MIDEFEGQINILVQRNYHKMVNLKKEDFIKLLKSLKKFLKTTKYKVDFEKGTLPFVIVVKTSPAYTAKAMSKVDKNKKHGVVKLFPLKPEDFQPLKEIKIPKEMVYLLMDIDRGKDITNQTPKTAFKEIQKSKRSPLTIDEGIAIITHYPEFLIKNNCFSLLASRHAGDKRVPAIWINSKKEPNLGWCWEGNPHSWLGSASAGRRL